MKTICVIPLAAAVVILCGCSTPATLSTIVGPVPSIGDSGRTDGKLRVFSATEQENNVGFEFAYNQRTDYDIYGSNGRRIEHVSGNNQGQFDPTPRAIQLPPGTYKVKSRAAAALGQMVIVPVVIEPGRTTDVHLNGHWRPPAATPETDLVRTPSGVAVGWRASSHPNS